MLARIYSSAVLGIDSYVVEVEVDIASGLPSFSTVGLPDGAVKESRERVRAAIKNSGYHFPPEKITVNLAPADIKKEGAGFDLPISVGILAASGLIEKDRLGEYLLIGELSLDGRVKQTRGILPIALGAKRAKVKGVILPQSNATEAAVVDGIDVIPVSYLSEAVDFLNGEMEIKPVKVDIKSFFSKINRYPIDFSDVKGQELAKRALEIAAAGNHNVLMVGPPGSGKTMLAQRLPTILPPLTFDEALETTKIYSVSGLLDKPLMTIRPFRSPHHTISDAGLIGGGQVPKPGEVSLAHNGVLFLDELPEFRKNVLEMLRQPLEDGKVTIARASVTLTYPSRFLLVTALNPCPCGYLGDSAHQCRCTSTQIQRYRSKLSGPLLDRIDLHVDVPNVNYDDLAKDRSVETSEEIRDRVTAARRIQLERFKKNRGVFCNSQMGPKLIKKYCAVDRNCENLLRMAIDRLGFSARGYHRILKLARTIADIAGQKDIKEDHLAEAIQYRSLDRDYFSEF
ncbi:MAG TPA: ATP-binding protein [Deltaproteobacteria bacterium]|nr:ATP-binding protein [Deltaproteobacteria bacterium]